MHRNVQPVRFIAAHCALCRNGEVLVNYNQEWDKQHCSNDASEDHHAASRQKARPSEARCFQRKSRTSRNGVPVRENSRRFAGFKKR
jgi:hypothetical protein